MTTPVLDKPLDYEGGVGPLYIRLSAAEDEIPPWGTDWQRRDQMLREFWPTEDVLSNALFSSTSMLASMSWEIEGPRSTAIRTRDILNFANSGAGWYDWVFKTVQDLRSQDNGAFTVIFRKEDDPRSPVVGITHVDAAKCIRTGNPEFPVIYTRDDGTKVKLKPHHVIAWAEMPSPIRQARGRQYSAVTRILRSARILRHVSQYNEEKLSGLYQRGVHIVSGVNRAELQDAVQRASAEAQARGNRKYADPAVLTMLDPQSRPGHVYLPFAAMPDNFNFDEYMKWYIANIANNFGFDYQDFAPLPGNNIGSSAQSQVMAELSRGKGPRLFMNMVINQFKTHGILPPGLTMRFEGQDNKLQAEEARLRAARIANRAAMLASGEITPEVARLMAVEAGDLEERYLQLMGDAVRTVEETVSQNKGLLAWLSKFASRGTT